MQLQSQTVFYFYSFFFSPFYFFTRPLSNNPSIFNRPAYFPTSSFRFEKHKRGRTCSSTKNEAQAVQVLFHFTAIFFGAAVNRQSSRRTEKHHPVYFYRFPSSMHRNCLRSTIRLMRSRFMRFFLLFSFPTFCFPTFFFLPACSLNCRDFTSENPYLINS